MKKLFAVISGASVLMSVGLSNASVAHADSNAGSRCTNTTIAGSFGIHTTGTIFKGAQVQSAGLFASTGLYNFDVKGNFITRQNLSANGTIAPFNASGTYNIEQDCTLTLKLTDQATGIKFTASGVVVKRGTEILLIETDPQTVITSILKRVY